MNFCILPKPPYKWMTVSQVKSLSTVCSFPLFYSQSNMKRFCLVSNNCGRKQIPLQHCSCCLSNFSTFQKCFPLVKTCSRNSSISSLDSIQDFVFNDSMDFDGEIKQLLHTNVTELDKMCCYYFDGKGKSIRPRTVFLMSKICNFHHKNASEVSESQRKVTLISEMIHISSLIHDDVVDISSMRRGKDSVNLLHGDKNAVMAGNYIMSVASQLLASIDDCYVTSVISGIVHDLVAGEFMQERKQGHFDHYLQKTYKKTASLLANCCKAVAYLSGASDEIVESAYNFGRNMGIAFQLVDDLLDYVASAESMGKPTAADLQLGLATAPVLFACDKHPDLYEMIARRFSKPGDVEFALRAVSQSDALDETRMLAQQYSKWAVESLSSFRASPHLDTLLQLTSNLLRRRS